MYRNIMKKMHIIIVVYTYVAGYVMLATDVVAWFLVCSIPTVDLKIKPNNIIIVMYSIYVLLHYLVSVNSWT